MYDYPVVVQLDSNLWLELKQNNGGRMRALTSDRPLHLAKCIHASKGDDKTKVLTLIVKEAKAVQTLEDGHTVYEFVVDVARRPST